MNTPQDTPARKPQNSGEPSRGWFKASRGEEPLALIEANPLAYVLAAVIAHRARWRETFNRHGLALGEAFLGDFRRYGMTERQYRTAKKHLEKWGFATFRRTPHGTIGTLSGTRLFAIGAEVPGRPGGGRPAEKGRRGDGSAPANEEGNTDRKERMKNRVVDAHGDTASPKADGGLAACLSVSDSSDGRWDEGEGARKLVPPLGATYSGGFGAADLPKPGPKSKVSKPREQQLMGRLRELLGEEEMRNVGGHWRMNWVRKHPELLMGGIADLEATLREEEALRRGGHAVEKPIENRAAYLTALLKDWKLKREAATR